MAVEQILGFGGFFVYFLSLSFFVSLYVHLDVQEGNLEPYAGTR